MLKKLNNPLEKKDNVIIIGFSWSGMICAKAMMNHFKTITIIDTDDISTRDEKRNGVPQNGDSHILLNIGYKILKYYFPELDYIYL